MSRFKFSNKYDTKNQKILRGIAINLELIPSDNYPLDKLEEMRDAPV